MERFVIFKQRGTMLVLSGEFAQSFCATFVVVSVKQRRFANILSTPQVSTSKYFSATNRITPLTNHVRSDSFRGCNTLDVYKRARVL